MKTEEIAALVEFNAWANHRVLAAAEALTAEQFLKEMGSSFGSVRDTLAHIMGAEWAWLSRLQGTSPAAMPSVKEYADVTSLRARWTEIETEMKDLVQRMTQADLDEQVDYKTFSYGPGRNRRWEMIQHVVNHGTYHRGQVTTLLRQMGAKGAGTDLILFYREREAAAGA
jgi:uncharacterized damage-inducible protein DinB